MSKCKTKKMDRVSLIVYLDRQLRKDFSEVCKKMHMGKSTVLRNFIVNIIKEQKLQTL